MDGFELVLIIYVSVLFLLMYFSTKNTLSSHDPMPHICHALVYWWLGLIPVTVIFFSIENGKGEAIFFAVPLGMFWIYRGWVAFSDYMGWRGAGPHDY